MAVNRPDFSRKEIRKEASSKKRSTSLFRATLKRLKSGQKKTYSHKVCPPKDFLKEDFKDNFAWRFRIIFFATLLAFLSFHFLIGGNLSELKAQMNQNDFGPRIEELGNEGTSDHVVYPGEGSRILGRVGLTSERMEGIARNIIKVSDLMVEEYEVSDGLTLGMYVLRYLAEIGEYELVDHDIIYLVRTFEEMVKTEVGEDVNLILNQIKRLRFGRANGQLYVTVHAKRPSTGIIIPINQRSPDPSSSLKLIEKVVIKDGTVLTFDDINRTSLVRLAIDFIVTPVRLLNVLEKIVEDLYQIHPGMIAQVEQYLNWRDYAVVPLRVGLNGVSVDVKTSTLFGDLSFDFSAAYAFPGMENGGQRVPSFALRGRSGLLDLKVSIDQ